MTAGSLHLHPMHQHHSALSPFGFVLSSLGGLAAGVGAAFLIWHLF